jgi:hypothetical protein
MAKAEAAAAAEGLRFPIAARSNRRGRMGDFAGCLRGFCCDGDEDFIGGGRPGRLGRRWRLPNRCSGQVNESEGLFASFGKRVNSKNFALFFSFGPKHPMAKGKQRKHMTKEKQQK